MGAMPPHYRLAVPEYVEWGHDPTARRELVVLDLRTGVHYRRRRAALEAYETLSTGDRLAAPGFLPKGNIMKALADLYQWGCSSRNEALGDALSRRYARWLRPDRLAGASPLDGPGAVESMSSRAPLAIRCSATGRSFATRTQSSFSPTSSIR
jgi:hypothetical protein